MLKRKNINRNKGITLIALIITIMVMLILSAVTIEVSIHGGLFKNADDATKSIQNVMDKEKELANSKVNIGGVWYDSVGKYFLKEPSTSISSDPKFVEVGTVEIGIGGTKEIIIEGTNLGALSIKTAPNSTYAVAEISGNKLTIEGKSEGTTNLIIQEATKQKVLEIKIKVNNV